VVGGARRGFFCCNDVGAIESCSEQLFLGDRATSEPKPGFCDDDGIFQ